MRQGDEEKRRGQKKKKKGGKKKVKEEEEKREGGQTHTNFFLGKLDRPKLIIKWNPRKFVPTFPFSFWNRQDFTDTFAVFATKSFTADADLQANTLLVGLLHCEGEAETNSDVMVTAVSKKMA